MIGLSTRGSISLGCAFVAGRNRVPRPAAGKTALRTFAADIALILLIPAAFAQPRKAPMNTSRRCETRIPSAIRHVLRWLFPDNMAYVIAEPCIGTKDTACVDACPVDCIH